MTDKDITFQMNAINSVLRDDYYLKIEALARAIVDSDIDPLTIELVMMTNVDEHTINKAFFRPMDKDAPQVKTDRPYGIISWQGTEACVDYYCVCGEHRHYDGKFGDRLWRCPVCGKNYRMGTLIKLTEVEDDT